MNHVTLALLQNIICSESVERCGFPSTLLSPFKKKKKKPELGPSWAVSCSLWTSGTLRGQWGLCPLESVPRLGIRVCSFSLTHNFINTPATQNSWYLVDKSVVSSYASLPLCSKHLSWNLISSRQAQQMCTCPQVYRCAQNNPDKPPHITLCATSNSIFRSGIFLTPASIL